MIPPPVPSQPATGLISFALYGPDSYRYGLNAVLNCMLAPHVYPGWRCRFYVDDTVAPAIARMLAGFPHAELRPMPRHRGSEATMWRYLAANDAGAVIFRNADAWLSAREAACVRAWLAGGEDFHIIRDHCHHSQAMRGGMWGVRGGVLEHIEEWIAEYRGAIGGDDDRQFLADWVYPLTVGRATVHRGEQHDEHGRPTDYMGDGAVAIPPYEPIDIPGVSWLQAHALNAFRCSHCGEVHDEYVGAPFTRIPLTALEAIDSPDVNRIERSTAPNAGDFYGGCGFDVLCVGGVGDARRAARRIASTAQRVFLLPLETGAEPAVELGPGLFEAPLPVDDPARPGAQVDALAKLCRAASIRDAAVLHDGGEGASGVLALARRLGFELIEDVASVEHPHVAIVVISFDNGDYLETTLESIFANTSYPSFEVIVVDNGSSPDVRARAERFGVRLIANEENTGFARACNIGIAAAAGAQRIVLLNDDLVLTPGWLEGLLRRLGEERAGLVGPVTNHARGEAQIEVAYEDLADLDAFAAANAEEHRGETQELEVLAMFCVAARAEVLQEIGPLDERFTIGMYEDDDYALRLRRAGYRLLCARDVFVHHWGGVSFRRLDPQVHEQIHATHRRAFEEKWAAEPPLAPAAAAATTVAVARPPADPLARELAEQLGRRYGARVPLARPGDDLRALLATAPAVVLEGGEPQLVRRLIRAAGGSDAFLGSGLAVALAQPLEHGAPPEDFRVRAYIPAFNEADILPATLRHLHAQGVETHVIDNWSTDGTGELCDERFGSRDTYDWAELLERVEELASRCGADWAMLLDADELRVAPWPGATLREALWTVQRAGFNAVDHTVLHFPPTDDSFAPGGDPRAHLRHAEFWSGPGFAPQVKAWRAEHRVRLAPSGGHEAEFAGRRIFPFNFLDEHYPLRSQRHAEQKVFRERAPRWRAAERARGWHAQYDGLAAGHRFLRSAHELELYDPDTFVAAHLPQCLARAGIVAGGPARRGSAPVEISVVYVTHRREPRFEWFADAFAAQLSPGDDVELIVVDGLHDEQRTERFTRAAGGRFPLRHVPAKPSPFNGPHRVTRSEFFAPANARNTGIVHARRPYVVFVDDLSLPMPGWWAAAVRGAQGGYVAAGAYQKHRGMAVSDGVLRGGALDADGLDSRWLWGPDLVQIGGGALYGCSLGAPLALLLELDGFDELCDAIAGEDGQLGYRMEHAGAPIYYDRRMLTIESAEDHARGGPALERLHQVAHPDVYMARLRELGVWERTQEGPFDSQQMVFDLVHGRRSVASLGNHAKLSELDAGALEASVATFPSHHWFDQRPLAEM